MSETSSRIIGLPYEQPVVLRSRKDRTVQKATNVMGAKSIATADHLRMDKNAKETAVFNGNNTAHVNSA